MQSPLIESYSRCEAIARNSGSSFYRSFALLSRERRNAMTALYAFARLADDATDDDHSNLDQSKINENQWNANEWHDWLDSLNVDQSSLLHPGKSSTLCLAPIRFALADSVSKFSIPLETLHDLIRGVDTDRQLNCERQNQNPNLQLPPAIRMQDWDELKTYCHRVASSVGVACLSIWAKNRGESPSPSARDAALDCGVAFQMTNILRDLAEDAHRNRVYLPEDELARFDIDLTRWLALRLNPTVFSLNEVGDWRGLLRLQFERTKALYESGWQVADTLSLDGQRMFSLMWHSYRKLLSTIEGNTERIWTSRIQLSKKAKIQLVAQHLFTPLFHRKREKESRPASHSSSRSNSPWPAGGPRVAVIGAGLAGVNAALQLARHGCQVTLIESKNRIGGRVGSFLDAASNTPIDYCQHVGMNCCTALKQFVSDTNQEPFWTEQSTLHFASEQGKRIDVSAWPLPAPFHLAGLLIQWPKLSLTDRIRIGSALLRLLRMDRNEIAPNRLAIDWLRSNGQNERCIRNFWSTILVSALGEQIDRVNLESTHKVLIDGFAADRTAFHLLVPNRPIAQLLDECVATKLRALGVNVRLGSPVKRVRIDHGAQPQIKLQGNADLEELSFDGVVTALPWNKITDVMEGDRQLSVQPARALQSSPITGVHTWWDRPWLKEPHAILIDRLSQWVFPAPEPASNQASEQSPMRTQEFYYQVVISASRDLPSGDSDAVLKMIKQDLAEIFPESAVATLLRGKVVSDPNAVFSVTAEHESGRLECNTLADDRTWLAGDWTATKWPATMEGALRSGSIAAEALLAHFGRNAKLLEER